MTALLSLRDVTKYFEIKRGVFERRVVKAVDGVSFDVEEGQTVGLVGESGSGKSTLALTVLRLYEPTRGQAIFEGVNLFELKGRELTRVRRKMGIVFQDPYLSLNPVKRVRDIVGLPLKVHMPSLSFEERESMIREMLEQVGLRAADVERFPHEFSGGQRQRIAIARALIVKPKFLILDEPTSALDLSVQAKILNLLLDLQREFGLTYLFITHDMNVIKHISDRINVMYLGKLVESADTEELFERPLHPYTRALLSSVPTLDPRQRGRKKMLLRGDPPDPANPPPGCRFSSRCPLADDLCRREEPPLVQVEPGHWVACHKVGG
ncbi:MAG: ATP-binding cassette domain-containing protein [Candidatus Korarchaeota archaeon]|nr:ATP-binding cassette domain-containing protein [Candidatus Korarchaeota archaeon]